MKRIIKNLVYSDLDNTPGVWYNVPFIPASASLTTESNPKAPGRLKTCKLEFKLKERFKYMNGNLSIVATYDDDKQELLGTNDLPLKLKITEKDYLEASCSWDIPEL